MHRSAVDLLTDTRREPGPTSEGSWAEDAGIDIEIENFAAVERSRFAF